jgi:hypothetical protein
MKTIKVNFLPSLLEPILYLLAFGFGLGVFIPSINGQSYISFIAPALVAIAVMNGSFGIGRLFSVLNGIAGDNKVALEVSKTIGELMDNTTLDSIVSTSWIFVLNTFRSDAVLKAMQSSVSRVLRKKPMFDRAST